MKDFFTALFCLHLQPLKKTYLLVNHQVYEIQITSNSNIVFDNFVCSGKNRRSQKSLVVQGYYRFKFFPNFLYQLE